MVDALAFEGVTVAIRDGTLADPLWAYKQAAQAAVIQAHSVRCNKAL